MGGLTWIAIGFLSGSIPFSVLIGRLVAGTDIRKIGDRNPGATNVFRAANRRWGVLAILLEFTLKAPCPLGWRGSLWDFGMEPFSLLRWRQFSAMHILPGSNSGVGKLSP